jgi:hypothetical protein
MNKSHKLSHVQWSKLSNNNGAEPLSQFFRTLWSAVTYPQLVQSFGHWMLAAGGIVSAGAVRF